MAIPLAGARVRLRGGKLQGQEGYIDLVEDGRDVLQGMTRSEQADFVKRQRARFGSDWNLTWYRAEVTLDSGSSNTYECRELEVLEPEMLRPDDYRPQRIR